MNKYSREECIDNFWYKLLVDNQRPNLLMVLKPVSTLSHGNANLERAFPINSECIVENMEDELLVAQRCVCDTSSIEKLTNRKGGLFFQQGILIADVRRF